MVGIVELARAKVNLALHITGRRGDGYHLLDSLVVFPEIGDRIEVEAASGLSLTIDGPFAQDLGTGEDNLVLKAAELIRPVGKGAAVHLTKSLPIASGIGGGSADAAATLRALSRLWDVSLDQADVLALGADVPVCLASEPSRMQGIGEDISRISELPEFWIVLVNPGAKVSTPAVFKGLSSVDNAPLRDLPNPDLPGLIAWLSDQRNDMEAAAISIEPQVGEVLERLNGIDDCAIARMSGSGATCFGIFKTAEAALKARAELANVHPMWWCAAAPVKG